MRALGRFLPWLLLLAAVVDLIGLKRGLWGHPPWMLSALVGCVVVSLLVRLTALAWSVARRRTKLGPAIGEGLLVSGVLLALVAGTVNWTLALQGFVILSEGEAVPLHRGSHLQQFEEGPLARLDEMNVVLTLEELDLLPVGADHFTPESHLVVQLGVRESERLSIRPDRSGSAGPLRFHQGAFGFAPRIVILKDEETVFDRAVPLTTRKSGHTGITFAGSFTIEDEGLHVDGSVDLTTLDAGMRGHATLMLVVKRDGEPIGRGRLLPGHFADLEQGYRIGFADLVKWSEVDISRRTYARAVMAGAVLALAGIVVWPVAAWRSR